ncbi:glycine-rich domain-containing protein [Nocardiopsis alba]|uniref:glycine-rich domain-containing protein n=1 Tax=Nocardiopsis alba TaxID=53437 RepID=UPI0033AAD888
MTTTVEAPAQTVTRDPRDYVAPEVWDRQILLLTRDHPWDTVMAERCFGQAVAYLITAMEKSGQGLGLGCGPLVDIAVHGFILDTVNYRDFCERHYGRYLEHVPEVEFKNDGTVTRTAHVIEANGFRVDRPLWDRDAAKCSPCAHGSDCH